MKDSKGSNRMGMDKSSKTFTSGSRPSAKAEYEKSGNTSATKHVRDDGGRKPRK